MGMSRDMAMDTDKVLARLQVVTTTIIINNMAMGSKLYTRLRSVGRRVMVLRVRMSMGRRGVGRWASRPVFTVGEGRCWCISLNRRVVLLIASHMVCEGGRPCDRWYVHHRLNLI